MHPVFSESFHFPTKHRCLGLELKPLAIGHLFLLREIGFPLDNRLPISRGLLLFAAMICAQPYPKAKEMVERRGFQSTFRFFAFVLAKLNRRADFKHEYANLLAYLDFHQQFVEVVPPSGKSRSLRAPIEWRLIRFVMRSHPSLSFDQAASTPMLRASAIFATDEERDGNLTLQKWVPDPLRHERIQSLWEWAVEEDAKRFKPQETHQQN